ncbi:hypothetical protein Bbelb_343080 [Branchiostoma belcheri]|nr:hypothetical protein Bbelb_343080 [Branchiostoma belcheri]
MAFPILPFKPWSQPAVRVFVRTCGLHATSGRERLRASFDAQVVSALYVLATYDCNFTVRRPYSHVRLTYAMECPKCSFTHEVFKFCPFCGLPLLSRAGGEGPGPPDSTEYHNSTTAPSTEEVNDLLAGAPLPAYLCRMPTWSRQRR